MLKPGGDLIAFCATRTVHRMTVGIEDAGFEIRDQLCWCYESGFPKSLNVAKQFEEGTEEAKRFEGWGTALKPAFEPAVLARKPVDGTIANNFVLHGVGGLNIEKTRFPYGDPIWFGSGEDLEETNVGRCQNIVRFKKAQRSEREEGLDHLQSKKGFEVVHRKEGSAGVQNPRAGAGRTVARRCEELSSNCEAA